MQAQELQEAGWTLVDVRVADKYEEDHIKGAVSIPLFRPVQGDSMMDNVKRLAMGAFAMKATGTEGFHTTVFHGTMHAFEGLCSVRIFPILHAAAERQLKAARG